MPSPTKKNYDLLTFPEAMQAVIDGKTVTKLEWADTNQYARLLDTKLMIHLEDGWHLWTVSAGDLLGQDWMVI